MDSDNNQIRINAMTRLPIIVYAQAHPEEKKTEILQFLETFIKKCDFDEIIFALARVLGDLAPFFGLDSIRLFNELLENEETVIRQEALKSYLKMVESISKDDLSKVIVPEVI